MQMDTLEAAPRAVNMQAPSALQSEAGPVAEAQEVVYSSSVPTQGRNVLWEVRACVVVCLHLHCAILCWPA
jgi:hypothetical protein